MTSELSEFNNDTHRRWLSWLVNGLGVICFLCALTALVALIGWNLPEEQADWLYAGTCCTAGLLFFQEGLRFWLRGGEVFRLLLSRWGESVLVFAVWGMTVAFGSVCEVLENVFPFLSAQTAELLGVGCINTLILCLLFLRGVRSRKSFFKDFPLTPGRVFILSFILLILAGTLLLKTPSASVSGISWCDALFLSTSAVCVTGLSPFDVALGLTFRGQCILLGLIQIGGLGVMSITYFFAYFFAGGLSLRNRFDFQDLFSEDNIGQIGTVLAVLVGFTFAAEAIGATAIYFSTEGLPIVAENPVFFSIFHSVSGFCNAGLSCVPGAMMHPELCGNTGMIFSVFSVALIGGLGFPVIKNFWSYFVDVLYRRMRRHSIVRAPVRLTTHTKLVLVTSLGIFLFGMVAFYFLDWNDWGGDSALRAFFLAGTSRTAGFDIAPTSGITSGAKLLLMALMFIGGSPFSTAGGIKTTTFAVAVLSIRQYVLGRRELEVFGRRLDSDVANQALAIVLLGAAMVFMVTVSLCILQPEMEFLALAFESFSAVGTVGLSCGVTPQLGDVSKYILVVAMFIGRIGILLFLTSFVKRREATGARLPEDTIVLS